MRKIIMLLVGFVTTLSVMAQTTARISGIVKDDQQKPFASATVSLLKAKDSSLTKLAISDKEGQYEFINIPEGNYIVSVTSVGYTKNFSSSFAFVGGQSVQVPTLSLAPFATGLTGVTVQSRRPLIENKIDKMVVNVDASPTNAGNTAMDVLEKSPGITVDRDGNISLKGKQGVIVLLDGKQTYLSGQDLANLLRNMPSSELDQIEIMTQPSAKFDAAGNSGIINLRTKKSKQMGFNGSLSLSYVQGVYPKTPNSFNFNYRKGKLNFFTSLSYSHWENFNEQTLLRKFRDTSGNLTSVFDQYAHQKSVSNNYSARFGVDYSIDKNTTLGVVVKGISSPGTWQNIGETYIKNGSGTIDSVNKVATKNDNSWQNLGANINFRRVLDTAGKELTADFDYLNYYTRGRQTSDNYMFSNTDVQLGDPFLLRGYLPSDITIYSGKADYVHPLKNSAKLEAGVKSSYVATNNDAQYTIYDHGGSKWISDEARSNQFSYKENINAAYINYSRQIKKWGLQTGLRVENTIADGKEFGNKLQNDTSFHKNYTQLFPTAYVSYAWNEKNNFTLSYGRRIERPNYQDMNPFIFFLDQYTYQQGNPNLTPQFTNNIELSHNYRGTLNTTLNYTATNDIINDILKQNDSTKVTFQTKENVASRKTIGIAISYNAPVTKWWTTSIYVNVNNNHYKGILNNSPLEVRITSFMAHSSQQFKFAKTWSAEVNGFYRSRALETSLFLVEPMGVVSFGFGKQILNNKGSLKLNISDPFYIQKVRVIAKFDNIDLYVRNRWDNRRIGLTFTYRFNKGQNVQQRKRSSSAQEEQNRVGGGNNQQ